LTFGDKEMEYITQVELAKAVGVSKQRINTLVKDGKFDGCFQKVGKTRKLLRDCALQTFYEIRDPSRQNQRDAVKRQKQISPAKKSEAINLTDEDIKDNKEIFTDEKVNELAMLLADANSSSQKVQITKDYWQGEINRLKALETNGELIPKERVENEAFEAGRLLRDKFQAIPKRVSTLLEGKDVDDIRDILENEINLVLEELSR
jgi:hypothetical protein